MIANTSSSRFSLPVFEDIVFVGDKDGIPVFAVHGENEALTALTEAISERGVPHVLAPERHHVAEL